ncbi:MAG: class I SAM-dependent methyltransferase [Gaiellaceae bacterium MAG52_C11]|nr:class I SAM-dependent methyltransferase [Candidatus Gaiellasilicea maunaloa]
MAWSEADAARNRELWTQTNADYTAGSAPAAWAREEMGWGIWQLPESQLRVFEGIDLEGLAVVELGCGTAYFSAWLAKRGAHPVGVDVTPAQLETARAMQEQFRLEFPLLEANAEETGLPDQSFDLALSEYGASIWCDPYRWIPEAARLLRPGGHLVFLRNSTLVILCSEDEVPAVERLVNPQFGMHRFEWPDGGVEFHLAHGEWIRLLREHGFEVEALHELQAPQDAQTHEAYDYVTADWGRKWPAEEIWRARKR